MEIVVLGSKLVIDIFSIIEGLLLKICLIGYSHLFYSNL